MLEWVAAALLVGGFILLLKPFRVIDNARAVLQLSGQVAAMLRDKSLSDLDKEKAMQRHSLGFFKGFCLITLGGAAALLVPFALVWLLDLAGLVSLEEALRVTMEWPFLIGATVVGIAVLVLQGRSRSTP